MIFKSKQFSLFVVVPQSQWLEYEDFAERMESTAASMTHSQPRCAELPSTSSSPTVRTRQLMTIKVPATKYINVQHILPSKPTSRASQASTSLSTTSLFDEPLSESLQPELHAYVSP
jgi:hypothetical protein